MAVVTVLLGGCLATQDPVWSAKNSKVIPALEGQWYSMVNTPAWVSILPTGEYEIRDGSAVALKLLLIPLQGDFYVVQTFDPQRELYYYAVVSATHDKVEMRAVNAMHKELESRASKHGIKPYLTTDPEKFIPNRPLKKADVTGFFKDLLALNAFEQNAFIDRLTYSRTPIEDPSVPEQEKAGTRPAPAARPSLPINEGQRGTLRPFRGSVTPQAK